jgi:hypothetical protein
MDLALENLPYGVTAEQGLPAVYRDSLKGRVSAPKLGGDESQFSHCSAAIGRREASLAWDL